MLGVFVNLCYNLAMLGLTDGKGRESPNEGLKSQMGSLAQRCLDLAAGIRQFVSISRAAEKQQVKVAADCCDQFVNYVLETNFGSDLADYKTSEYRGVEGKLGEILITLEGFADFIKGQGVDLPIGGVEAARMRDGLGFQQRAGEESEAFSEAFGFQNNIVPRGESSVERMAGLVQKLNLVRDRVEYILMLLEKAGENGTVLNLSEAPEFGIISDPDKMEGDFFTMGDYVVEAHKRAFREYDIKMRVKQKGSHDVHRIVDETSRTAGLAINVRPAYDYEFKRKK